MNDGFFARLFDLTFQKFITSMVVPVYYVLGIITWACASIALPIVAYNHTHQPLVLIVAIFGAALLFLIGVVNLRMGLEFVIVHFKISKNTRELCFNTRTYTKSTRLLLLFTSYGKRRKTL